MRVVLYGDSMTEYLHKPPKTLMAMLGELKPDIGWDALNYAIGATRAELVLYRMEYEFWHGRERMIPLAAMDPPPDVLVVESCAFNNSADRAEGLDNYRHILNLILETIARQAPKARVVPYLCLPSTPCPPQARDHRLLYHALPEIFTYRHAWREVYQEAFADWARECDLPLVNVRKAVINGEKFGTPREAFLAADMTHPNRAGVELTSRMLAEAIADQFNAPTL